jgi:murein DD-endopeptidase MepM/ murein hydrolase activator NlpD
MPEIKKSRSEENNKIKNKKVSPLKRAFKKYNEPKVTLAGLKMFFYYASYRVGFAVDVVFGRLAKNIIKVADFIRGKTIRFFRNFVDFLEEVIGAMLNDLGEPLRVVTNAFSNIKKMLISNGKNKNRKTFKNITGYIKQGLRGNRHHAGTIMNYRGPALGALALLITVNTAFSREYGMDVYIDGKNVGTIKTYAVLESADKMIEDQLISKEDNDWQFNAKVKLSKVSSEKTLNSRQLTNNILNASSADIVKAAGLYVNGEFRGAVRDADWLRNALNTLKAPYENGDENRTVSFVEDVNVVDGIYFTSSVVAESEMEEKLHGEISGEKKYTVVTGDSPYEISHRNGITLKTLYNLNPGLENGGLWVGDELIVAASVPFLQVKYTERSTRDVAIPYKTITKKNNSMALGTTKVSQQGEEGIREEVVESLYIDGVFRGETVVQSSVKKEPVDKEIQLGTLWNGQVITGGSGKIIWPVPGSRGLSRGFAGQYPRHNGLDIRAAYGTPIVAADSGVVTKTLYTNRGYGIYCVINHGSYRTLYGHCSALYVSVGQQVTQGQVIARIGSTGWSTGPHCHFEVQIGNVRYDPYKWF